MDGVHRPLELVHIGDRNVLRTTSVKAFPCLPINPWVQCYLSNINYNSSHSRYHLLRNLRGRNAMTLTIWH